MSQPAAFATDMEIQSPQRALDEEYAEDRGEANNEFLTGPNVDELCCQLLDALLTTDGSIAWKGEVVLRLKEIFEAQQQKVLLHGVHHHDCLSTPVVKHVARELICRRLLSGDSFLSYFELELLLRCIVAALRVLASHASQESVSTEYCEELYHGMSGWFRLLSQSTMSRRDDGMKSYNNDFLVLYAKDLIASISTNRNTTAQACARMIAAVSSLDPMYGKNFLNVVKSLQHASGSPLAASHWHARYRTVESLCLSVRAFQTAMADPSQPKKTLDQDTLDDDVVSLLLDLAVDQVIAEQHNHNGIANPTEQNGNLVYATLDLLQQYIRPLESPKIVYKVIHQAVALSRSSPYSYLRCKAFELLSFISMKHGFGYACVQEVNGLLASGIWQGPERDHVAKQWIARRKFAADMTLFLNELKDKDIPINFKSSVFGSTQAFRSVDKIVSLANRLEENVQSLGSSPEDPAPLPCGHIVSTRAWRDYEARNPGRRLLCPICRAPVDKLGDPLPTRNSHELLRDLKSECSLLKGVLQREQDRHFQEVQNLLFDFEDDNNERPIPSISAEEIASHDASPTNPDSFTQHPQYSPFVGSAPDSSVASPQREALLTSPSWVHGPEELTPLVAPSMNPSTTPRPSISQAAPVPPISPTSTTGLSLPLQNLRIDAAGHLEPPPSHRRQSSYHDPETVTIPSTPRSRQDSNASSQPGRTPSPQSIRSLHLPLLQTQLLPNQGSTPPYRDSPTYPPASVSRAQPNPSPEPVDTSLFISFWANSSSNSDPTPAVTQSSSGANQTTDTRVVSITDSIETPQSPPPAYSEFRDGEPPPESPVLTRASAPPPDAPSPMPPLPMSHNLNNGVERSNSVASSSAPSSVLSRQHSTTTVGSTRFYDATGTHPVDEDDDELFTRRPQRHLSTSTTSTTGPRRAFHLKSSHLQQIGPPDKYVATAISETCRRVVFLISTTFLVYEVEGRNRSKIIVVGGNDGRYGIVKGANGRNPERRFTPTFAKAGMTDKVLAIACLEGFIDIHETQTGKRIGSVPYPDHRRCMALCMSPNGQFLVAGMDNGDAIVYVAGESGTFEAYPPRLIRESGIGAINSIAFSCNSKYVSLCMAANVVHTYELRGTEVVKLSKYDRDLLPKQCKSPYFGVTGISYLRDSKSLLVVADADKAYPLIVKNIVQSERSHVISSLSGKDGAYKYKNIRVACNPSFDVAIVVTRSGTVKLINCNLEDKSWQVKEMSEEIDVSKGRWMECSVRFSVDGTRGIVLDWKGRMMFIELD